METEGQTTAIDNSVETTEPSTTTAVPSWIGTDGTLSEKWTESLDSELRTDKTLGLFKNVKDLAKSYVNVRGMVGKDKVAIPTDKSTPAEWEAFYTAGGRPTTAGDYKLDYPKDMPTPEVPELRKSYIEFAHKTGMSQKQAESAYAFYNNIVKQSTDQYNQQKELERSEAVEKLKTTWGTAYEQRLHFGNMALEEAAKDNPELKERLINKFGNDPDFILFSSNLGNKFVEHRTISANIPTPSDIQTKIDELMQSPAYMQRDNPAHKTVVEQVQRLFVEKTKR